METDYLYPDIEMCSEKDSNNAGMEIIKDSHVVVRFELEKRNKYFLGQVLQLVGNVTFEVNFLRHKGNGRFAWPVLDDVSIIDKTEIVQVLPNPTSDRRGIKTFDLSTLTFKIE